MHTDMAKRLRGVIDPAVWAEAFQDHLAATADTGDTTYIPTGTLTEWFSLAIETAWTAGYSATSRR